MLSVAATTMEVYFIMCMCFKCLMPSKKLLLRCLFLMILAGKLLLHLEKYEIKWYFSYLREKLHDPSWVAELSGYHSHRITKLVLIKTSQARQFCSNLNILIKQAMLEWSLCYQSTLCICSVWSAISFDFSCLFSPAVPTEHCLFMWLRFTSEHGGRHQALSWKILSPPASRT